MPYRTIVIDSKNPSDVGKNKKSVKKTEETKKIDDLNDSCRCIIL